MSTSVEEVTEWVRVTARLRAQTVVPVVGGEAVLHGDFPFAHDHNKLLISSPCDAAALATEADRVLGAAGCAHRLIDVLSTGLADDLAPGVARGRLHPRRRPRHGMGPSPFRSSFSAGRPRRRDRSAGLSSGRR